MGRSSGCSPRTIRRSEHSNAPRQFRSVRYVTNSVSLTLEQLRDRSIKTRMSHTIGANRPPELIRRYKTSHIHGSVFWGDALEFLGSLRDKSADVVFLDPPFNLNKTYSTRHPRLDSKPHEVYDSWLTRVVDESTRVLAPGGVLYLYHLPKWAIKIGCRLGQRLVFQHWIAVSMKNGFVRGRRLYPAHYALLMFSSGPMARFKRPKIPLAECRHCGEYIKDYGGYLPIVETKGLNLSDVWDDLSPVRHSNRKHRTANELPPLLFKRICYMSGGKGRLYIDPFAGTGTGIVEAVATGMRFSCCDLIKANTTLIEHRLASHFKAKRQE